jgi:predicted regulator of Ras-like GTPase activity (Roadblock/LC7/MglB family)
MSTNFAVMVTTKDGKVLDYAAPLEFPKHILEEAAKFGFEIYSIVHTIVKELGYSMPRNITVKTSEYEVTVFDRGSRLVFAIFTEESVPSSTNTGKALAET